ncbi:hypothetical protein [Ramlibacter humi]|uniref:Uncharacterized protein n=1 Tax=Ramlibacter humi TaxID=2530451 RepID=A0A4Z0BLM1_9BURK|nr:hypothetical protein [Ramlibacter humi]TFZ00226.1 hypothetical protein EZ216_14090 [Ramlibacter humi]
MSRIDVTNFPKFGSMTGGSGLTGIFADNTLTGYAQSTVGFAGVDLRESPQAVDKIIVSSADNGWDASGASGGQVQFRLFGKKGGGTPVNPYDGVLLGRAGPIRDINQVIDHAIYSTDWATKWDFIWIVLEAPVWTVLSGFKLFAPVVPQIGAARTILRRRSDSSQPIAKNGCGIPGMRFLFELTQPAAVVPIIKIEIEHMAWATGMSNILSCGCYLFHRSAPDLAALASASYRELDVSGRNLSADTHYERHEPRDAVQLDVGFHEIIPNLNSNTYQANTDWYTNVLVEYGRGLNKGLIDIDPGAVVVNL